jgi:zinc protease
MRNRALYLLYVSTALLAGRACGQELAIDGRLVSGKLPNGLSYYVMPHDNPPKRVSVWMQISSGSLNETDKQRGIAHYLEHMAFNGSKNFPPGTVVKYFESLGLTFGRHQNAFTSFDQTCYQLALPDNSIEKLRQGLLFMSDVNGRLLLEPTEIDSERQIILQEKTARKSGPQRIMDYMYTKFAPGSIYGERSPIGTEESIKSLQKADFVDYYSKHYTASNSAIIVVGDIDPKAVVSEITGAFSDLPLLPRAADQDVGVKPYTKSFAVVATDPEITRCTVGFIRTGPAHPPTTTTEMLRAQYLRQLSTAAFNRGVQDKVSESKVSFLGAIAFANNMSEAMWVDQAQASGEPVKWKQMLTDLAAEVQRTRLHGFSQQAIDEARKDLLASAEQQMQREPTLPARAHLGRINSALIAGEPVRSAQQRFDAAKELLPTISVAECGDWFAKEFDPSRIMFFVQIPSTGDVPTEAQVLEVGEAAFKATPAAEGDKHHADKFMAKLPSPGAVAEQSEHAPSSVWSAWLSNGVRVHHKFSDYHKNEATITISLIGGRLLETPEDRGVANAASVAWSQQATGTLTTSDIRSIMMGKKVDVGGGSADDSMSVSVSGSPDELETGMQLAYLLLTDPKVDDSAFARWKTAQLQNLDAAEKNPSQTFSKLVARTIYPPADVRTQPLTKEQVETITPAAAQAWLVRQLAQSPIEVAVVGDIPRERAIELVTRYVGSLPTRRRVDPAYLAEKRVLAREKASRTISETMKAKTDTAYVQVCFYGPDSKDVHEVRAMQMAGQIITSRMVQQIREKDQLVYSISAGCTPGSTYPGFGVFRSGAPTQPQKTEALAAKIAQMFEEFAKDGPTDDEMKVAKGQMANTLDESMKEPRFWLSEIASMTYDNRSLDDVLAGPAIVASLSPQDVKAAFNKYYSKESLMTVMLKPVAPE